MAAVHVAGEQQHAAPAGSRVVVVVDLDVTVETPEGSPGAVLTQIASAGSDVLVVGTSPGHNLKRAVHGSVSAYCSAHLPGRVTVVAADPPGQNPRRPGRTATGADRSGPVTRAVRW
jgi:nucleotide-binding universal stress UspA family protein